MDVRAIVLVDGANQVQSTVPLCYFPVAGRAVLTQVVDRLFSSGCDRVSVLHTQAPAPELAAGLRDGHAAWKQVSDDRFWKAAEDEFSEFAQDGAELVLVYQLGPYVEADFEQLIQKHLDGSNRVTQLCAAGSSEDGSEADRLPIFAVSASRRNDAAALFRSQLERTRNHAGTSCAVRYVNPLADMRALRQLALDSLSGLTAFRPEGSEIRPGIWLADGARVHKTARLVAPCYIGAGARVAASALVTRGSVIEHHSEVDCGTAIENATVLPCSYVGPGLDLAHSVLRFDSVTSLKRNVSVQVEDGTLASALPHAAGARTLRDALSLVAYLPQQILRGLLLSPSQKVPDLADSTTLTTQRIPAAQQSKVSAETNNELITTGCTLMRRYGNE